MRSTLIIYPDFNKEQKIYKLISLNKLECHTVWLVSLLLMLQLIHSLLMPAVDSREPLSMEFQTYLVQCSGLQLFMGIITDKNFMIQADTALKRYVTYEAAGMLFGLLSLVLCFADLFCVL